MLSEKRESGIALKKKREFTPESGTVDTYDGMYAISRNKFPFNRDPLGARIMSYVQSTPPFHRASNENDRAIYHHLDCNTQCLTL